ncbi:MAG: deoxyribodipyrimidine photo-lyase, partial [Bacteroidia bacterium]
MGKGLIWFRNDLRLHDNEALHRAILTKNELLPVYIKQRKISRGLPFLEREESSYKRLFLEESLFELNNSFNKIGGDLLIKEGNALDLIPKLCLKYSIDEVFASFEYANDELKEQEELGQSLGFLGIKLRLFHTGSLIHPDDLPFAIDQLPDIFTVFRKKVESLAVVRPSFADVTKAEFVAHSEPSYIFQFEGVKSPYTGGELAGLVRVDYYIHQNQLINEYKQTRNGLLGLDYSSKFSPWLALGCLSPR